MPKKGRAPVDPIKTISDQGFIGYVEEENHQADEPGVIWIGIEAIRDNPYQHAEDINADDFQSLVESIKADGFLGALNVSPHPQEEEMYYLNGGGHQRRDAARAAGLVKLPVFVTDEPVDRSVLAFRVARENTTRVNTSILNLGSLYQQMMDEFGLTQEEIAQRIGKDRNHVKFALTAVRSAPDIQDMLRQRPDSLRAMTYFRRLEQIEDRRPIMEQFIAGTLSTEGVRQEVEALLARQRGEAGRAMTTPLVPASPPQTIEASPPLNNEFPIVPERSILNEHNQIPGFVSVPPSHVLPLNQRTAPDVSSSPPVLEENGERDLPEESLHQIPQLKLISKVPPVVEVQTDSDRERTRNIQAVFQDLQIYQQQVRSDQRLTDEERRMLEAIISLSRQLVDAE